MDPNVSVCGVRIKLELQPGSVNFMKDKRVLFNMGAWLPRTSTMTSRLPYTFQTFPVVLIALEPDQWLLQVHPGGYIRFDHGLDEIMGTALLSDSKYLLLPGLGTPIKDTLRLSNVDFSKCFVEVDIVEMSMSGKEQRHTLALPASKVRSDLRISSHARGFPTFGGAHATPEPAPSALKVGVHVKAVFWLVITALAQISRSRFKQSRISMLIPEIYVLGHFVNFFG